MARTIITETPAGTSNSTSLAAGDELIVAPGVILADDTLNAIGGAFGGNIVHILGSVLGGANGVSLSDFVDDVADSQLTVAAGGSVVGEGSGIVTSRDFFEIQVDGAVQGDTGIRHGGGQVYSLVVGATGIVTGFRSGIEHGGDDARLTIHGQVTSLGGQDAIRTGGDRVKLVNYGVVTGVTNAFFQTGADGEVVNHGDLIGDAQFGSDDNAFSNFGTLQGDAKMDFGDDRLGNAGLIDGDVTLSVGDDVYDGRGGRVTGSIDGGEGDDLYILDRASDASRIVDAEGTDRVEAESSIRLADGIENLTLLDGGDWRGVGNGLANTLRGNAGDNRLVGRAGEDVLIGGLGDDRLRGGGGADLADYGESDVRVIVSLLDGTAEGAEIGQDRLRSIENVRGGDGGDRIGGSNGANTLEGGLGADRLQGEGGADSLLGGAGQDRLDGGRGSDVMTGGEDADRFAFLAKGNGQDTVTDFADGEDRLDLRDLNLARRTFVSELSGAVSQVDGNAVIDLARLGGSGSITLEGVNGDVLDRSDFLI
ncbi:MAG: calcium-binding protein [Pseudomonadota bacterium]